MKGSGRRACRGKETKKEDNSAPSERVHSTTYIETDKGFDTISTYLAIRKEAEKKGSKEKEQEKLIEQERHTATKGCGYRDFSHVQANDSAKIASIFQRGPREDVPFPVKLHSMLSNPELEDVIMWLPHGRAWRITRPKVLEEKVLPLYFSHCRLSSFMRQVNGWGFIRVKQGPDYNSYYHELFLRGLPHLVPRMRRKPGNSKVKGALRRDPKFAPDFYKINEQNPLTGCKLALSQKCETGEVASFDPAADFSSSKDLPYQFTRDRSHPGNIHDRSFTGMTLTDRHASNMTPRAPVHNTQYNQTLLQPISQSCHRLEGPSKGLASSNHSLLDLSQFLVLSDQPYDGNKANTTNETVGVGSRRATQLGHNAMLLPPSDSTFDPQYHLPTLPLVNPISLPPAETLSIQSADQLQHVLPDPSNTTMQQSPLPLEEESTDHEENEFIHEF